MSPRSATAQLRGWLLPALLLLGCLRLGAETVLDIPLHGAGYGTAFFEESARRFEALRPGVRVRISGDPRMADKLRIRAIGGSQPDATTAELYWPRLIKAGRLVDLTPYLSGPNWEGDSTWGDSFLPGALDAWRTGEGTFGIPFAYSCWSIFYNKRLFRDLGIAEPETWDDFFAACDKLRASGVAPVALPGVYLRYGDAFLRAAYYDLAGSSGWRAFNNMEPGSREDSRFVQAAGVLSRLADGKLLAGWQGLSHTGAQLALLEGRAAMIVSGSWFVNEMKGRIPGDFELGTMNFPGWSRSSGKTAIQTSSEYFFVFENGDPERIRLTIDFLRFLTSRENAAAFARQVDSPVAVRGVPETVYSPLMRDTVRMINGAREAFSAPPNMLLAPGLAQAMTDARLELFTRKINAEEFASRLEVAAGAERRRAANPSLVEARHPLGALVMALGAAGVLVWCVVLRRRRRRDGSGPADTRPRMGSWNTAGFVGPAFVLYSLFILLPAVASLGLAFFHWDGIGERSWAGFFNFKWLLLESDVFWSALGNNLFLVFVPALFVVPISLSLAYLIHGGVRGASFLRSVLLFPNLLGGIAATLLWMNIYEPHGGLAGSALGFLGGLFGSDTLAGLATHPWLAPQNLYWSMVPIYIWMACGFNLVLYLAAMEGIDQELYEAASMDGASRVRQFFSITLPQIRETVAVSVVFIVIGGLNAFEMVWLLTSQDPPSGSHTMGTLLVTTLFKEFQVGRATAIAVLMLGLVLASSALVLWTRKEDTP